MKEVLMNKEINLVIKNARLVREGKVEEGITLALNKGFIQRIGAVKRDKLAVGSQIIDAKGLYVSPGFIDLQLNGGAGYNFEDTDFEEMSRIIDFYVTHGTTGILPTTVTAPIAGIRSTITRVKQMDHPAVLGMHIEGPFISKRRKGAQNPEYICDPSIEKLNELIDGHEGFIRIMTLAPELPGVDPLISRIREIGAIPSLGHSDAGYEEALTAIEKGVGLFTHMFNAMRGFHHREPGAVGAALVSDVMVELIPDNIHVHPAMMRLLYKAKGADRICLITDAISATGLTNGEYQLGGLKIVVKDGQAQLGDGTLAGSTLTMDRAVKNFMDATGCSLPEAVQAASLNPARLLGIADRKGSLELGKDADIIIFDKDLNIHYTVIGGALVYSR
jgi:N-acetylglucosamine-6-phosphate deacetylase